jgi:hypothetical protein
LQALEEGKAGKLEFWRGIHEVHEELARRWGIPHAGIKKRLLKKYPGGG